MDHFGVMDRDAKEKADARALWAVRVLDAWGGEWGWSVQHMTEFTTGKRAGFIVSHGDNRKLEVAWLRSDRDAARIAAAEALVAEDPSLGEGL